MALNDVWQVAVRQEQAGQEYLNVLHMLDLDGTQNQFDIESGVSAAWCATDSVARDLQTVDVSYVGIRCRNITQNSETFEMEWTGAVSTGQINTETAPPSVCLVYTLRTGLGGRSRRGRIYFSGVRHDLYAAEQVQWSTTNATGVDLANMVDTFQASLNLVNLELAVYSRKLGQAFAVTSTVMRPGLGSQRHRANRYALP